jgi:hypothetical protein
MSKIVKKKDLDVLIESTLEKAGIKSPKKKVVVKESYFRFDPKGSWFDVDDYSHDELPENDYEDNQEGNTGEDQHIDKVRFSIPASRMQVKSR